MKLYEVKGTGKLQGMTVMSLDAFVKGVKPEKEMDESDISGLLHAARNYNRAFLITADLAEGGRKTYRVKAQSERIAREKFEKHYAMAKIVGVKEEGVAEGNRFDEPLTGYHIVYKNSGNPVSNTPSFETKDQAQKYLMTKMFANHQDFKVVHTANVGVAEGFFGIDDKIKGKIQNIVSDLSDIPGMWDHKAQTFTDAGMDKLKTVLKNNPKYIKYALNLDYRDYEAEGVAEGGEFGAYYYEQLAQQTFDINPNLQDENEILNLGYKIAKGELGSRAQGIFRDEDFSSDFVSAYGYLTKQGVAEGKARLPQPKDFNSDWDYQEALDAYERPQSGNDDYDYENMIDEADTENPDRITIASQGKGYIVYHSFNRDAYTARGVGEWKGQIQPEWFYSLADAEDHAEMEIAGHDEHYGKIDELTFKGSTCTKDCSGHEAGYNWYQRKGRVPNSHSKSFNKGADIAANESVNEAPGDFGLGANYRDIPDDEMQAFLDRTKNKEKTKRDKYDYPYVHASSIQIKNEDGREYDLDSLRKEIMTRPASILGQNAKMQHSETGTEAIFDIGLPALKGLAVNEKTGQFVVVDTCPGAGACKTYCYAMKGSYVMFKAVSMGLARMLNFLLNDPEGFKNKLNAEIAAARSKMAKKGARVVVRWHDAGDFFSPEYLDMAYGVARDNPDVGFYAYTKIADVATGDRPKNFNMNFSQGALSGQEKKVDFKRVKHSKVVPKDMFFDLVARKGLNLIKDAKGRMQFASPENLEDFKTRMAKHYAIDKDSILTYDQMMDTPVGNAPKWNVIVMPGDGDNSANRNDVIGSYLLFH